MNFSQLKKKIIYRFEMLENGEFPNLTEMEEFQLKGINCFAGFDENPELIRELLQNENSLIISDTRTIDDSFDDPFETNPFKILNQTNPLFASASEEFNADNEMNTNLKHSYSSNSSEISDDSLDTID